MTPVPLAYKYVATAVMLMEINYCASRLHLQLDFPIQERDILKEFLPEPGLIGFGGRFAIHNYDFCFVQSGSWTFSEGDIKDLQGFAQRLLHQSDPISALLWQKLPRLDQDILMHHDPSLTDLNQVEPAFIQCLNGIVSGSLIYEKSRFAGIELRPETIGRMNRNPEGADLARVNRLLIEDVYSAELSRIISGRLCYIINYGHPWNKFEGGTPESISYLEGLTRKRSQMDTNGAYRQATNWLAAIDVDVQRLERNHPAVTEQLFWMKHSPLPLFNVKWNRDRRLANGSFITQPAVSVFISGDTGELIHLRQEDGSYSKRPSALIKGMEKLLTIPDEEFLEYSEEQRSNLVARFAAVQYPPLTNQINIAIQGGTNNPAQEKPKFNSQK